MTTSFVSVATLSEQELLDHFEDLVVRDRRMTAELLVAIAEIDERKIWAKHGCSSMFTFCMERFHMSEQVTAKRLWAARTARRFPVILRMVECGELHLGAIHLLARHLTAGNHVEVLERAKHKSCREVEGLVAELAPRADVPSRIRALPEFRTAGPPHVDGLKATWPNDADSVDQDQVTTVADRQLTADNASNGRSARTLELRTATKPIVPLSPRRYKIEITVDEETHDKLRSLQDLLGRSATGRDPAAIISRAIEVLLDRTLTRRAGCTDRPKQSQSERADSIRVPSRAAATQRSQRGQRTRTIPAAVRREVWKRDCGRCCYMDARGHRCAATSNIEFHHRKPYAAGGAPTPQNIELRCAAHNQYQADLDFGRSFMDGRREKAANIPRGMSADGGRGKDAPEFTDGRRGKGAPTLMDRSTEKLRQHSPAAGAQKMRRHSRAERAQ
jgi:5-methylcytosine-specific restriction endonuclease McrA